MYKTDSEFFRLSRTLVENFLQTTVIVDDQVQFSNVFQQSTDKEEIISGGLVKPGRKSSTISESASSNIFSRNENTIIPDENGSHFLDAQKVINSFAQKRIVCSIIKPSKGLDWQKSVIELAHSTDIVILDWELEKDNGKETLNILKKIISATNEAPAQSRLLIIYTGEPGIAEIAKKTKKVLATQLKIKEEKILEQDGGFSLSVYSIRLAIFSKPGTVGLPEQYNERRIKFDELANQATTEFSLMTAGLVSNAAIHSLAVIRDNTHTLLNKFSTQLDAPYLTHRALQEVPEDAEELLTDLVAEELRSILEEESIGSVTNIDAIRHWLLATKGENYNFHPDKNISMKLDDVISLLSNGISKCEKISKSKRDNPHNKLSLTTMFIPNDIEGDSLDEKFGLLTIIRSHYQKRIPKLTFGSILQCVKDKTYWVCLQPRCDSIRIGDDKRAFPMLPLEVTDKKFRLILLNEDLTHIKVLLKDKPYNLNLITFACQPGNHGAIIAKSQKKTFYFTSTARVRYRWVGELKTEQAQRLANEFAANLSRVGLDESEWLRLNATKG